MEQRYDAVTMVMRDGFSITEVAAKFNVTRQTVYRWLSKYEGGGLEALGDESHRPHHVPHQMDGATEVRVLDLRRRHHLWGPKRIQFELKREGWDSTPSHMAIYRALVRAGLIVRGERHKVLKTYKRWERGRPMELWQMDVVGSIFTTDGTEAKVLTGIDDHSRFLVCHGVMARATARPVNEHFVAALTRWGVPDEILTDNGKVFTGRFGRHDSEVLFDKICRENGINHILTRPRSPTTTGKIERWHYTLRREFVAERTFSSLADLQGQLDAWVHDYNTERPHQELGMATPSERFSRRTLSTHLPLDASRVLNRSGDEWVNRTVASNGVIAVSGQVFSAGKHRAGRIVDVKVTESTLEVWDGSEFLKAVLRTTKGAVRKKRAQRPTKRE
ncbi:MAG: IS481 family transposase [Acidimicrobiales bacterium]